MRNYDLFHQQKPVDPETKTLKVLSKYNVRLLFHDGSTGKGDSNFFNLYNHLKQKVKANLAA
jgi:hypothetical protein